MYTEVAKEIKRRDGRRGRGRGRVRWGRLRRYGEQNRRMGEEDEREEELPSLVASIHEGEIITALMAIENLGGWM